MKSIRHWYEELGAEGYYRAKGDEYANPHVEQIHQLIQQNESRIDYTQLLDLSCGGGEVSEAVLNLGYKNVLGCDPYTHELYRQRLQHPCLEWGFDDLLRGALQGQFSTIIASFALHLCPEEQLFPLTYALFQNSPQLVVISPHKRPALEPLEGVQLQFEDFTLTERGKKVRLKAYSASFAMLPKD